MRKYIGIDNGLSGGIVVLDDNQNIIYKTVMPILKIDGKSEYNIKEIISIINDIVKDNNCFAVLEKAHVRPISGKRQSFMTGYGYGLMRAVLETLHISYEIVNPQTWMKALDIPKSKEKGSILYCQQKWPNEKWTIGERSIKVHDGLTDAAAMALYCYRLNFVNVTTIQPTVIK